MNSGWDWILNIEDWMGYIALLHDIKEKDLARDLKELLEELDVVPIKMMMQMPDGGATLDKKEADYFEKAVGAIFLITPGSERMGKLYPSLSVSHEMGQARQKFANKRNSVIYLVDKQCNLPTIDQQASIMFDSSDIRFIVEAITQLIRNLKAATLLRTAAIPQEINAQPQIILERCYADIDDRMRSILLDISNLPDGMIEEGAFNKRLKENYQLTTQGINLIKREFQSKQLLSMKTTGQPYYYSFWIISELGWNIVRLDIDKTRHAQDRLLRALLGQPLKKEPDP